MDWMARLPVIVAALALGCSVAPGLVETSSTDSSSSGMTDSGESGDSEMGESDDPCPSTGPFVRGVSISTTVVAPTPAPTSCTYLSVDTSEPPDFGLQLECEVDGATEPHIYTLDIDAEQTPEVFPFTPGQAIELYSGTGEDYRARSIRDAADGRLLVYYYEGYKLPQDLVDPPPPVFYEPLIMTIDNAICEADSCYGGLGVPPECDCERKVYLDVSSGLLTPITKVLNAHAATIEIADEPDGYLALDKAKICLDSGKPDYYRGFRMLYVAGAE